MNNVAERIYVSSLQKTVVMTDTLRVAFVVLMFCAGFDAAADPKNKRSVESDRPMSHDVADSTVIRLPQHSAMKLVKPAKFKDSTKILFWTTAYGRVENWNWWFSQNRLAKACPEVKCKFTIDKSELNSSDVIVFMAYRSSMTWDAKDPDFMAQFPPFRRPEQRWVYMTIEPPDLDGVDQSSVNGLFNWTMTFRRDSDIVADYGHNVLEELETPELREASIKRNYAEGKNKMVAWYVSHCHTDGKRELYVEELQKHMQVDIYGKCGQLKCEPPRSDICYKKLAAEYKFYLSFENVLCKDYVTEKFTRALSSDVVPVVFGGADYTKFAPLGSYINALDFQSPKQLATYLNYLNSHDDEYNKYFNWKRGYRLSTVNLKENLACDICRKSLDPDMTPKVYNDMNDWWYNQSNCREWKPPN